MVRFPKFKGDYDIPLRSILMSMGINKIFGDGDFSAMTSYSPIMVSDIKQNSYIDINEKGVEAAAVTTTDMVMGAWSHNEFIADRPFLYMITEQSTGAILFIGKYTGE